MDRPIYLDFAAATPLDARVFAVMEPFLSNVFYNPSSAYGAARNVRKAYEDARTALAGSLGAKPYEIILTAGATESANLALQGVLRQWPDGKLAVSSIEHQAVRSIADAFKSNVIAVDQHGIVNPAALKTAVDDETVVVSIGMVNSEIGIKQPVRRLVQAVQAIRSERESRGIRRPLYFHSDASQAVGTYDLHASRLGVDMMTLSAGKIYGPKQAGLLYVRRGVQLQPLIYGGGQEQGLRSGTENVASSIGFAEAMRLAQTERQQRNEHLQYLKKLLEGRLKDALPDIVMTVPVEMAAPHILHFSLPGIDAERLLFMCDERGLMVSTGAACAANRGTASHVLQTIGMSEAAIQGSVRCSFGHTLREEEVVKAADILIDCMQKVKPGG